MSDNKKMTTGGFFRSLLKFALTGTDNPINTVVQKGLEEHERKEAQESPKVIQAKGEEVQDAPCGNPDSERAGAASGTQKT